LKAPKVWASMIEAWEARLAGDTIDAEAQYAAARNLAAARGYRFLTAKAVAALPTAEFEARVDEAMAAGKDKTVMRGVLGAAPPEITVSRALELFWEVNGKAAIANKSPDGAVKGT
jgi:hypothetical protein